MEPLSDAAVRTLAERYAEIVDSLAIAQGDPLLVLPNAEFFPDRFTGDAASVERLAARMQGYAGLENACIDVRVIGEAALDAGGGCGTGGCGTGACATPTDSKSEARLEVADGRYVLRVPAAELGNSIVLTARLAASLGAVALLERHSEGLELVRDPAEAELAAVGLGFGVLLLEASYIYKKGCGGPNVSCGTALSCQELSMLFALSVAREEHSMRAAVAELGTTQRVLVKDAAALVAESPGLVRLLRDNPGRAALGEFRLRDGRSFLSRLFTRKGRPKSEEARMTAALAALERGASVDELAAIVGPADGE